tara:strand:- start:40006 stop:40806 length:801 start_codon:yes stop_codon:yes gene_type:complete
MQVGLIFGLTAIVAIMPAVMLSWRAHFRRDIAYWAVLLLASAGPLSAVIARLDGTWQGDFATTIWVTIAATMGIFLIFAASVQGAWRLTPLVSAYMLVLALMGLAWQHAPDMPLNVSGEMGWLLLHISFAVATYALATLAAVASLAAFIQERALKRKQKPMLDGVLPAITQCDRLVVQFLAIGEAVLAAGLLTGATLSVMAGDGPLPFDHKTVFTLGAFIVIGILLYAQVRHGVRGRRAARIVLLAYLLLTLGYPGVKFVTEVLLT